MPPQRKRAKRKPLPYKARARARRAAQPPPPAVPGFERTMPFPDWCRYKGFSVQTGKRLIKTGRVRITWLSPGRFGVTESADRAYMRSCESA
jgi:hypothetical protein